MVREPVLAAFLLLVAISLVAILPGFVAAFVVGAWHFLPGIVQSVAGFRITVTTLVISILITLVKYRRVNTERALRNYTFPLLIVLFIIGLELRGGIISIQAQQIAISVFSGFLFAVLGTYHRSVSQIIWGFAAGAAVYGIGETIRVAFGGEMHAQVGAFGANPIFGAHLLGLAVFGILSLRVYGIISRRITVIVTLILAISMAATGSWGSMIAFAISVLFMFTSAKGDKRVKGKSYGNPILIFGSLLLGPILIVFREAIMEFIHSPDSQTRINLWKIYGDRVLQNPLFGSGIENLYTLRNPIGDLQGVSPHNVFLEMWAAFGIFPLAILVGGLIHIFRSLNYIGQSSLIFITICFSVSGSLPASYNFWIGISFSIIIGTSSFFRVSSSFPNEPAEVKAGHASKVAL